jgi:DNA polymerase I
MTRPTKSSAKSSIFNRFRAIWVVDFEFAHYPTGLPDIVCLAARELHSGESLALWRDQLGNGPPYDIGEDALLVFYSGMEAELACHLTLGWPLPANCVDLIVEYRMAINGREPTKPPQLAMLAAAAQLGVSIKYSPADKDRIRERISLGWPFSETERAEILDYVQTDVDEELALFRALSPQAASRWAVWRGEFIKSVARMWSRGVPIGQRYKALGSDPAARLALRESIIADLRADFPFYDGVVLKNALLADWLTDHGIPLKRTTSGLASTDQEHLNRLAREYRILEPFVEAHHTLGQLKEFALPIGTDLRLRAWFAPFLTATSRAASPTNGYIYNLPAWVRAAMAPPPGAALAYLDYSAMEFGIAAALSRCHNKIQFYNTGEPYLATAVAFGAGIPPGATKQEFPAQRDMFKTGLLACLYGIGRETLAKRLRRPEPYTEKFLCLHHEVFAEYWQWSDAVVRAAILNGRCISRHGWVFTVRPPFNIRSLRNWPIQTMGADIMRCACIFADRLGIEMLATAHDGILIQASEDQIECAAVDMLRCMKDASRILLDGFELRVGTPEIRRHGERFVEGRAKRTLAVVDRFLGDMPGATACS